MPWPTTAYIRNRWSCLSPRPEGPPNRNLAEPQSPSAPGTYESLSDRRGICLPECEDRACRPRAEQRRPSALARVLGGLP